MWQLYHPCEYLATWVRARYDKGMGLFGGKKDGKRLITMDDIPLDGKRVLLRVDFNVSIGENGTVDEDEDYRIESAVPTIHELMQRRCKIIVATHLGRPQREQGDFELTPVHHRLEDLLKEEVRRVSHYSGPEVEAVVDGMESGTAVLLPNVRLDEREVAGSDIFAQELASSADVFVNEAFSVCHRPHASVALVPKWLPSCAGRRTVEEYEVLNHLATNPERPYVAIVSGAKVHTKLGYLRKLLTQVDTLCVGGILANMFLANQGKAPKASFSFEDMQAAKDLWAESSDRIVIPRDVVIGSLDDTAFAREVVEISDSLASAVGVWDVGPKTVKDYLEVCASAKTIMWNGPIGLFEKEAYAEGTRSLAAGLAELSSYRVAGGGDTAKALEKYGLRSKFDHVSVGGGALVALIEGLSMPGLEPLFEGN